MKVTPEALKAMSERRGTWAAYQNIALDSDDLGKLRFLKYGADCTLKEAPKKYPDTSEGPGWRYEYVGTVNLETGEVDKP
jgi:hypothetical protein